MTNYLKLHASKLDVGAIHELVLHESCGAVSLFVGITRDNFEDKRVVSLEYEAYEKMALKSMHQICEEMRVKWSDIRHIAIHHRLGEVQVKEASVVIAVSSPHRKTSLDAVEMAIDRLKQIVPIWKKERYADSGENNSAAGPEVLRPKNIFQRLRAQPKLDLARCVPVISDSGSAASGSAARNLVQIHADESEVRRRVDCFIERKRDEINMNNVQDFIEPPHAERIDAVVSGDTTANEEDCSCARIRSSVYHRNPKTHESSNQHGRFHLRVHRVKNEYGPQTRQNYTDALDKLMQADAIRTSSAEPTIRVKTEPGYHPTNTLLSNNEAMDERLTDAERALNIQKSTSNVYVRLKALEARINYLESVSPEYSHFITKSSADKLNSKKRAKITHSVDDINEYINELMHGQPIEAK